MSLNYVSKSISLIALTILGVCSSSIVLAGGELFKMAKEVICQVPLSSVWNSDLQTLTNKTEDIFIAQLIKKEKVRVSPTIKPDFEIEGGIAADSSSIVGGSKTLAADKDIWNSIKWTFKVIKPIKGDMNSGEEYSFVSLERVSLKDSQLSPGLCDYKLSFKAGQKYLLFKDAFHPDGYNKITGEKDSWLLKVKSLVETSK
jgi:hypothetical protein